MPPVTRFDTERFSGGVVPLPYENIAIAQIAGKPSPMKKR